MNAKSIILRNKSLGLFVFKIISRLLFLIFKNKIRNRGSKNRIINKGGLLRTVRININGSNNTIIIGELTNIKKTNFTIIGNHNLISIGDSNTVKHSEFWTEDNDNTIRLQSKVRMNGCHLAATEGKSIIIGSDCLFSKNIDVRTGDSHSIVFTDTMDRLNPAKNVTVGEHVWVGKGVVILKGVTVGSNSIIAINSIVVKDVPENSIVAGNPAKVIKNDVNWQIDRI